MVFDPATTRIGWIGTGVMGRWMCEHLMVRGGFKQMTVYNRTAAKADPLLKLGARLANTPAEVAENADVVFTIVGYPKDVRQVILNEESGVLRSLKPGSILVDMTTSQPSLAQVEFAFLFTDKKNDFWFGVKEIAEIASKQQVFAIDAPVSGGDVGARNATLSFMIGGDSKAVDKLKPMLEAMGKNITHLGGPGSGQHTKMVNQILIATMMIGVVEGLLYGYKAGLNLETVIKAVGSGAAGSWSINNYGPRMIQRNFDPGFFVEHFIKDLEIALDECRRMNLSLPGMIYMEYCCARV